MWLLLPHTHTHTQKKKNNCGLVEKDALSFDTCGTAKLGFRLEALHANVLQAKDPTYCVFVGAVVLVDSPLHGTGHDRPTY